MTTQHATTQRHAKDEKPVVQIPWGGQMLAIEVRGGDVRYPGGEFEVELPPDWVGYGYFRDIDAPDGDSLDVIVGPGPLDRPAFVAAQLDPEDGEFTQWKVMLGWSTEAAAEAAFLVMWPKEMFGGLALVDAQTLANALRRDEEPDGLAPVEELTEQLEDEGRIAQVVEPELPEVRGSPEFVAGIQDYLAVLPLQRVEDDDTLTPRVGTIEVRADELDRPSPRDPALAWPAPGLPPQPALPGKRFGPGEAWHLLTVTPDDWYSAKKRQLVPADEYARLQNPSLSKKREELGRLTKLPPGTVFDQWNKRVVPPEELEAARADVPSVSTKTPGQREDLAKRILPMLEPEQRQRLQDLRKRETSRPRPKPQSDVPFTAFDLTPDGGARNITEVLKHATQDVVDRQKNWYQTAHADVKKLAEDKGVPVDLTSALVAILSPNTQWGDNVYAAEMMLSGAGREVIQYRQYLDEEAVKNWAIKIYPELYTEKKSLNTMIYLPNILKAQRAIDAFLASGETEWKVDVEQPIKLQWEVEEKRTAKPKKTAPVKKRKSTGPITVEEAERQYKELTARGWTARFVKVDPKKDMPTWNQGAVIPLGAPFPQHAYGSRLVLNPPFRSGKTVARKQEGKTTPDGKPLRRMVTEDLPKISAFHESILNPEAHQDTVVLDGHAINIWRGKPQPLNQLKKNAPTDAMAETMREDYRKVAKRSQKILASVGVNIDTPLHAQQVQAVTWVLWSDALKAMPKAERAELFGLVGDDIGDSDMSEGDDDDTEQSVPELEVAELEDTDTDTSTQMPAVRSASAEDRAEPVMGVVGHRCPGCKEEIHEKRPGRWDETQRGFIHACGSFYKTGPDDTDDRSIEELLSARERRVAITPRAKDAPREWHDTPRPEPKREQEDTLGLKKDGGVENILAVLDLATPDEKEYWGRWYHDAARTVRAMADKHGIDPEVMAAVVAVLSPGSKWATNVVSANKVVQWWKTQKEIGPFALAEFSGVQGPVIPSPSQVEVAPLAEDDTDEDAGEEKRVAAPYDWKPLAKQPEGAEATVFQQKRRPPHPMGFAGPRPPAYPGQIERAVRILETGDVGLVTGPKVTVFFQSLLDPDYVKDHLVLDGHAQNIWHGIKRPIKGLGEPTVALRERMLADYAQAAEARGLSVQAVQAITWFIWKSLDKDAVTTSRGKRGGFDRVTAADVEAMAAMALPDKKKALDTLIYDSGLAYPADFTAADARYTKWKAQYAKHRSVPRAVWDGGELDSINRELGLTGDERVSSLLEGFERLTRNIRRWDEPRLEWVVGVLREVPGLEGLRLPEFVMERQMDDAEARHYESLDVADLDDAEVREDEERVAFIRLAGPERVNFLKERNPQLGVAIDLLAAGDPTGGKHAYLDWSVRMLVKSGKDNPSFVEGGQATIVAEELVEVVRRFHRIKRFLGKKNVLEGAANRVDQVEAASSDINRYKSPEEIVEIVLVAEALAEEELLKDDAAYDVVFEDDVYIAYDIKNKQASCVLGAGTDWCVAKWNQGHFESYTEGRNKENWRFIMVKGKKSKERYLGYILGDTIQELRDRTDEEVSSGFPAAYVFEKLGYDIEAAIVKIYYFTAYDDSSIYYANEDADRVESAALNDASMRGSGFEIWSGDVSRDDWDEAQRRGNFESLDPSNASRISRVEPEGETKYIVTAHDDFDERFEDFDTDDAAQRWVVAHADELLATGWSIIQVEVGVGDTENESLKYWQFWGEPEVIAEQEPDEEAAAAVVPVYWALQEGYSGSTHVSSIGLTSEEVTSKEALTGNAYTLWTGTMRKVLFDNAKRERKYYNFSVIPDAIRVQSVPEVRRTLWLVLEVNVDGTPVKSLGAFNTREDGLAKFEALAAEAPAAYERRKSYDLYEVNARLSDSSYGGLSLFNNTKPENKTRLRSTQQLVLTPPTQAPPQQQQPAPPTQAPQPVQQSLGLDDVRDPQMSLPLGAAPQLGPAPEVRGATAIRSDAASGAGPLVLTAADLPDDDTVAPAAPAPMPVPAAPAAAVPAPAAPVSPPVPLFGGLTREDVEGIGQRLWGQYKESYQEDGFTSWKDMLMRRDLRALDLEADSDAQIHRRYIDKAVDALDGEGIDLEEVFVAYRAGTLPSRGYGGGGFRVEMPKFEPVEQTPVVQSDEARMPWSPKVMVERSAEELMELWQTSSARRTKRNAAEVDAARKDLYYMYVTDGDLAEKLGVGRAELNRRMRTMSGLKAKAAEFEDQMNANVPAGHAWVGVTNSTWLGRQQVSPEDLDQLVREVAVGPEARGWYGSGSGAEIMRRYIANTFLAVDTGISYRDLGFKLDKAMSRDKKVRGLYESTTNTITIDDLNEHTVAHEIGHALDFKFGAGFWSGKLTSLARHGLPSAEYMKGRGIPDEQAKWGEQYVTFVKEMSDRASMASEYYQDWSEVFARFLDAFTHWTAEKAGTYRRGQTWDRAQYGGTYDDKFTDTDFRNFVRLLQVKSYLDRTHPLPAFEVKPGDESVEGGARTAAVHVGEFREVPVDGAFMFAARPGLGMLTKIDDASYRDGARRVQTSPDLYREAVTYTLPDKPRRGFIVVAKAGLALKRRGYQRYVATYEDEDGEKYKVWIGGESAVEHGSYGGGARQRRRVEWLVKIDGKEVGTAGTLRDAKALAETELGLAPEPDGGPELPPNGPNGGPNGGGDGGGDVAPGVPERPDPVDILRNPEAYPHLFPRIARHASVAVAVEVADLERAAFIRPGDAPGESAVIVLRVPEFLAKSWPKREGDSSPPHVTLLYLEGVPEERFDDLARIVESVAEEEVPVEVAFRQGVETFESHKGDTVVVKGVDAGLDTLRATLRARVKGGGFTLRFDGTEKPAHATLGVLTEGKEKWSGPVPEGAWVAEHLELWGLGPEDLSFALTQDDESSFAIAAARRVRRKKRRRFPGETYYTASVGGWVGRATRDGAGQDSEEFRLDPDATVLREGDEAFIQLASEGATLDEMMTRALELGFDALRVGDRLAVLNQDMVVDRTPAKRPGWIRKGSALITARDLTQAEGT